MLSFLIGSLGRSVRDVCATCGGLLAVESLSDLGDIGLSSGRGRSLQCGVANKSSHHRLSSHARQRARERVAGGAWRRLPYLGCAQKGALAPPHHGSECPASVLFCTRLRVHTNAKDKDRVRGRARGGCGCLISEELKTATVICRQGSQTYGRPWTLHLV